MATASLDWSQGLAVESVPGRRSDAWVFRDTWMPVATVLKISRRAQASMKSWNSFM